MSDSSDYASRLVSKFDYENSSFHEEPRLDIVADVATDKVNSYDFLLASEVFEHVPPPVDRAFQNVFRLLKPGGVVVLTVPYGIQPTTIEHFPELHEFTISRVDGDYQLTNTTRAGVVQNFDRLIFHGGLGATLEMRIFSESDLIRHLARAGFIDIEVYRQPCFEYGIWFSTPWSLPISARKPCH